MDNYKREEHVERIPEYRLPLQVLRYQPQGKRRVEWMKNSSVNTFDDRRRGQPDWITPGIEDDDDLN